ncbi:hypothetical protein DY052_06245 [Apilactobacillus timberlakei]|uniref:hypothetical protein n=1 Tax=Apilactobacillus timberlakei TaxID=2008380 RepID=UPI00112C5AD0|nr:hypothetical protein [Apilactobacillus timberlakei]TPR15024.1 hypothetical protein DY052_06245 [Apilactobacillus timberlakei]
MRLIYAFSCGISSGKHKFYIKMNSGTGDVMKLLYRGNDIPKRSSIVIGNVTKNGSNKYVVIGSKKVDAKKYGSRNNNIPIVQNLTQEGLWNRYWQTQFKAFMDKYKLSFHFLPMIMVGGYHIKNQKIMADNKYYFKIHNTTSNTNLLKENAFAQVETKYGKKNFMISEIVKTKDVEDKLKSININNIHDLNSVLKISNNNNDTVNYPMEYSER